jgi:hypothetical protein
MQTIALIIVLQVVVTLLTGCAEFPIAAKMEEMRSEQLTCSGEDESLCAGWKV